MMPPEKVLISAFVGSDNLGDEAVFLSLVELLATRFTGCTLTAASTNPSKTRTLLKARNRGELARVRITHRAWLPATIATHDTCIFGGGGIIQDQSSLLNLAYFLVQIQLARLLRKKVVLAFVGVGPIRSKLGRLWTRIGLSGVSACIVRDDESRELLQKLGVVRTRIYRGADIALNLECQTVNSARSIPEHPYILLSLRHWYDQHRFLTPAFMKSGRVRSGTELDSLLRGLARELSLVLARNQRLRIVAVPFFGSRDELIHRELFARFEADYQQRLKLTGSMTDPCKYLELAGSATCVVAMRLHALILGSLVAAPLVALSYSPKVAAYMKQLDLEANVLNIEHKGDVRSLADCIAAAERDSHRMSQSVEKLRRSNTDAMQMLCRIVGGK